MESVKISGRKMATFYELEQQKDERYTQGRRRGDPVRGGNFRQNKEMRKLIISTCAVDMLWTCYGLHYCLVNIYWSISLDDIKTQCVPLTVNYRSSDKPLEVLLPPLPSLCRPYLADFAWYSVFSWVNNSTTLYHSLLSSVPLYLYLQCFHFMFPLTKIHT